MTQICWKWLKYVVQRPNYLTKALKMWKITQRFKYMVNDVDLWEIANICGKWLKYLINGLIN